MKYRRLLLPLLLLATPICMAQEVTSEPPSLSMQPERWGYPAYIPWQHPYPPGRWGYPAPAPAMQIPYPPGRWQAAPAGPPWSPPPPTRQYWSPGQSLQRWHYTNPRELAGE